MPDRAPGRRRPGHSGPGPPKTSTGSPRCCSPEQETVASPQLGRLIEQARKEAGALGDRYVSTEHLLAALTEGSTAAAKLLTDAGVTREAILAALAEVRGGRKVTDQDGGQYQALERFGRDLTEMARQGKLDPVIGRDEVRQVVQVLSRRTKNNPVLIGEPGVGKTAIVEGLAGRIVDGDVPSRSRTSRISPSTWGPWWPGPVPGRVRGAAQGRARRHPRLRRPDHHLHRRAPHRGRGGGGRGSMDAGCCSSRWPGAAAHGRGHRLDEYKHIEKDAALERRFQPVLVGGAERPRTVAILRGLEERYESTTASRIKDSALVAAAVLSDR